MLTKAKLKEQIKNFPEEFSLDALIERLILVEKIELANKQSENGETIPETELQKEIEKSLKGIIE
jgi:hypothetical protein